MNGKGSKQRPRKISQEDFAKRWDAIFNNNKKSTITTPDKKE